MALFKHTEYEMDQISEIVKEKKLSKFLGTDFLLKKIRAIPKSEIGNFRVGSMFLTLIFGGMGYYFYKRNYQQTIQSSHGYYRLINLPALNAGGQFWWHGGDFDTTESPSQYYRMPKKEFDIRFRLRSAYLDGEYDHSKEILLPRTKYGEAGYEVITPFYYYYMTRPSENIGVTQDGKPVENKDMVRNAIAVKRGW